MCRTERPLVEGAHREINTPVTDVTARDFMDFVGLRELGRAVGSSVQVEYWKSAPYFVNFLEGYQVGERLKSQMKTGRTDPAIDSALTRVSQLDAAALEGFQPLDLGNARLRSLAERTVGQGWWQLLWVPPSMPYLQPSGPYAEPFAQKVTKQLVFSSWSATPTAIASLLSYEADRRLAAKSERLTENTAIGRRRLATALTYRVEDGRAAAMSTLSLFWPHPALAALTDPLQLARLTPSATLTGDDARRWAGEQLGAPQRESRRSSQHRLLRLAREDPQRPGFAGILCAQPTHPGRRGTERAGCRSHRAQPTGPPCPGGPPRGGAPPALP